MAKHYYYRCDSASEIGKKLKKLLNDCQKAELAQMDFRRKCGAESIVPVDDNFEGGVIGVTFADDKAVNKTVWKEIVKDRDGKTIWRPNCEYREGVVISKNDSPKATISCLCSLVNLTTSFSLMHSPLMRMRSRKSSRWGEVKRPTQ